MKSRLSQVILVLVIAALAVGVSACKSELPADTVAKVGDTYITAEQFEAAVTQEASAYGITKEAYPDIFKELEQWVIGNLVANELAAQKAAELGLSVTDEEVQVQLDSYRDSYYAGDQAAMDEALAAAGMTLDLFTQNVKDGLLRDKVKAEVVKDVISVPEADVVAYYQSNVTSYYVEPSRSLRHILIKPEASAVGAAITDADWAEALATAREVRRRLVAGGDWTELAAQYSDDFTTKDEGGDMGTILLGESIKEFEDAAFALSLDEISQPVKTVYGYEIIQATDVTIGGQQKLDEVRAQIESQLLAEAQEAAWEKWLEQAKANAGVIYRSDLRPAPTPTTEAPTTTESPTTTTLGGSTTT